MASHHDSLFPSDNQEMGGTLQSLPAEMLSEIFGYFVKDLGSPWTLVEVCKGWKQTALMTPQLWSSIRLVSGPEKATSCRKFNGKNQYFPLNDQLCFTEAQIHAALTRCGAVPLTVIIDYWWNASPTSDMLHDPYILLSKPLSERIEELLIVNSGFMNPPDLGIMMNCKFPRLKVLEVRSDFDSWGDVVLECASRTAHHLEELKYHEPLTSRHIQYSFWPTLKRFVLENNRSLGTFNLIVPQLVNIEALECVGSHWPDSQTSHITLHKLRDIKLKCERHLLRRLHLPKLESLHIVDSRTQRFPEGQNAIESDHKGRMYFPCLTNLSVVTDDPCWITGMEIPELRVLSITCHRYGRRGGSVGELLPMPKIETLILDVWWEDVTLLNLLVALPAVRVLTIRRQDPNQKHGLLLLDRLASTRKALLLPYLETLRLGDPQNHVYTKRLAAVSSLRQLVATRKQLGRPLKEVSVCWNGCKGKIYSYA